VKGKEPVWRAVRRGGEGEAHGEVEGGESGEGSVGGGVERAAGRGGGAGVVEVETAQHLHQERLGEPLDKAAAAAALCGAGRLAVAAVSISVAGGPGLLLRYCVLHPLRF